MLMSILKLAFDVTRNLTASQTATKVIGAAAVVGQLKKNHEEEKAKKMGLNLYVERKKDEFMARSMGMTKAEGAAFRSQFEQNSLVHFVLNEKDLEEPIKHLAGEWVLTDAQLDRFVDGRRHLLLEAGVGEEASKLKALAEAAGQPYESMSFLWEVHGVDFQELRILSDAMLQDSTIRRTLKLDVRH